MFSFSEAEFNAIKLYTSKVHHLINGALRGDEPMTPELHETIAILDICIRRHRLEADLTLYRGINGETLRAISGRGGLRVGMVVTEPAFVSTSRDLDVAKQFSSYPEFGINLHMSAKRHNIGLDLSQHELGKTEKEVLLPIGARWRITAIHGPERRVDVDILNG
jgi:hypothetical protein